METILRILLVLGVVVLTMYHLRRRQRLSGVLSVGNDQKNKDNILPVRCGHKDTPQHISFEKYGEKFSFYLKAKDGKYDFCQKCWESKVVRCVMCGKAIHFDEWICLVSGPVKYSVAQGAYCSDSDGFYVACSDHSNSFFDIAGKWTQNGVNRLYKVFGAPEGENHIWQWKEVGFEPVESEEYISRIKNKIH